MHIKFLVTINFNRIIFFVTKCYGGRSSDSYITNDSGYLHELEADNQVFAEKGFAHILKLKKQIIFKLCLYILFTQWSFY